jgi:transposase-like protein
MFDIINTNICLVVIHMANNKTMNALEFQDKFNSNEACYQFLYEKKWPEGFRCPKCDHHYAFVIKTRKQPLYECASCKHQTTLTVGTVFERIRKDLRIWFNAIYLVSHDKRGASASQLARELGLSYQTAWLMLHKIRFAMGERDAQYTLAGLVELDETFVGAPTEGGKRGRGTDKNIVIIGLSVNSRKHPLFVKMKVIPDVKSTTIVEFAKNVIDKGTTIVCDAYHSYRNLLNKGFQLDVQKFDVKASPDHLKWLHKIIANLKSFIQGTFHGLDSRHLQAYINEFCYRFNRRKFKGQWFDRLLECCVFSKTITYPELTR